MVDETAPVEDAQDGADSVEDYAQKLLAEAVQEDAASDDAPASAKPSPWDDPAKARAEIERLRHENAKDRTAAKENARRDLLKELGLVKDENDHPDPADVAKQLKAKEADARQARVELAVYRAASAAGADPAALLDSSSFLAKTADLDITDDAAIADAIRSAVESNPRLAAVEQGRLPSYRPAGDVDTRVPTRPVQLSRQDIQRMSPDQIVKAKADGQLDDLLSGNHR